MRKVNIKISKLRKQEILVGLVILILLISLIISKKSITPLEELTMKNYSEEIVSNLDVIDHKNNKLDRYVIYTLKYYKSNKNIDSLTVSEINNFIKSHFNIKTSKKKIEKLGITPTMVEERVTFIPEEDKYKLVTNELSYAEIAKEKIVKYNYKKVVKVSNNKYKVTYSKYVVKDPYKVLNYYMDLNNKNNSKKKNKTYDTSKIEGYLKGKNTKEEFTKYITEKNISKVGKIKEDVVVTYIVDNQDILIDEVNEM